MHDVKLAQQVQLFRAVLEEEAPPTPTWHPQFGCCQSQDKA